MVHYKCLDNSDIISSGILLLFDFEQMRFIRRIIISGACSKNKKYNIKINSVLHKNIIYILQKIYVTEKYKLWVREK